MKAVDSQLLTLLKKGSQFPVLRQDLFVTPCPSDPENSVENWIVRRVAELAYTAVDMRLSLNLLTKKLIRMFGIRSGVRGFRPNSTPRFSASRRRSRRRRLMMDTFPIVKRKDIAAHGEYRTKRLILEIYDAMTQAERTGAPYVSAFDDAADS